MKLLILIVVVVVAVAQEEGHTVNKEFLTGLDKFSSDIFREVKKSSPGNFVVSPLSVDLILSLIEYGSKGETSKQLVKGLNLPQDKIKLHEAVSSLTPRLNVNGTYTLNSANKVYVKTGYKLKENFQQFAVNVYNAEVENVDFEQKDSAAATMNKWVEHKTFNKINQLISEDDLNTDTLTVLLNALYFKGEWITQFDKDNTKKDVFYVDASTKTEVELMHVKNSFRYHESRKLDAKFLELPYVGLDVTLTLALPNQKDGLKGLEEKIVDVLNATYLKYEQVIVKIPKFKIESKVEFKPILQNLGVVNAFEDSAEFPEITDELLKISKVVQKAVIEVDEAGTTAAAATAVIAEVVRSAIPPPRKSKEFIADHPFIFILKYKSVILFVGHYTGQ